MPEPEYQGFAPGVVSTEFPDNAPQFPGWGGPEGRPPVPRIPGQLELPVNPQPVGTFNKVVTALVFGGLLYGVRGWGNPTLKAAHRVQPQGFLDWLEAARDAILNWIKPRINYLEAQLSHSAAHTSGATRNYFDVLALRELQSIWNLAYLTHELRLVIGRIIHTNIPRAIRKATHPIITRVKRVETSTRKNGQRITVVNTYVHTQIEKILKPEIITIKKTVTKTLPARITKVEREVKTTTKTVTHDHRLVVKLAPLLVPALAAVWILKTLKNAGLGFLSCQNMKDLGSNVCASPLGRGKKIGQWFKGINHNLLDWLIAGTAVLAIPLSLNQMARDMVLASTLFVDGMERLLVEVQAEIPDYLGDIAEALPDSFTDYLDLV